MFLEHHAKGRAPRLTSLPPDLLTQLPPPPATPKTKLRGYSVSRSTSSPIPPAHALRPVEEGTTKRMKNLQLEQKRHSPKKLVAIKNSLLPQCRISAKILQVCSLIFCSAVTLSVRVDRCMHREEAERGVREKQLAPADGVILRSFYSEPLLKQSPTCPQEIQNYEKTLGAARVIESKAARTRVCFVFATVLDSHLLLRLSRA